MNEVNFVVKVCSAEYCDDEQKQTDQRYDVQDETEDVTAARNVAGLK